MLWFLVKLFVVDGEWEVCFLFFVPMSGIDYDIISMMGWISVRFYLLEIFLYVGFVVWKTHV